MSDGPGHDFDERTLIALHQASLTVASELALDRVLQQIVEAARTLARAQYAAIGVPNRHGLFETFIHSGMEADTVAGIDHLPQGRGLLGAIISEQRTIRLNRIDADSRSSGFPAGHPPMDSFLGVPVVAANEVLGNLYLTNKIGAAAFSAVDELLVEMLAANAAVAIENARLYAQVERLAVVEERSRIGMALHDGVIQAIYGAGLTLESARLVLGEQQPDATALLDRAVAQLNEAIQDLRNYIMDLHPRRFRGNLEQGLIQLVREFQANTLVPITLDYRATAQISSIIGRTLFLTTQEALANIARHADASQVWITVSDDEGTIALTIRDDGVGFNPASFQLHTGHGLANMRIRANDLAGRFKVRSAAGDGTTISLSLPLS